MRSATRLRMASGKAPGGERVVSIFCVCAKTAPPFSPLLSPTTLDHHARLVPHPSNVCCLAAASMRTSSSPPRARLPTAGASSVAPPPKGAASARAGSGAAAMTARREPGARPCGGVGRGWRRGAETPSPPLLPLLSLQPCTRGTLAGTPRRATGAPHGSERARGRPQRASRAARPPTCGVWGGGWAPCRLCLPPNPLPK